MRTTIVGLCVFAAAILVPSNRTEAQARLGLDIQNGEVRNFYFAIGDYYRVPVREIVVVRDRGIPEDEIPVVYYIARHSEYEPSEIAQMRLEGESWIDISARCGVGPDAYSADGYGVSGPPYGNAYGYYKHQGRHGWKRSYLSDDDIITSVNARWMRDRCGFSAPEVIRWRSHGESFRSTGDIGQTMDETGMNGTETTVNTVTIMAITGDGTTMTKTSGSI